MEKSIFFIGIINDAFFLISLFFEIEVELHKLGTETYSELQPPPPPAINSNFPFNVIAEAPLPLQLFFVGRIEFFISYSFSQQGIL